MFDIVNSNGKGRKRNQNDISEKALNNFIGTQSSANNFNSPQNLFGQALMQNHGNIRARLMGNFSNNTCQAAFTQSSNKPCQSGDRGGLNFAKAFTNQSKLLSNEQPVNKHNDLNQISFPYQQNNFQSNQLQQLPQQQQAPQQQQQIMINTLHNQNSNFPPKQQLFLQANGFSQIQQPQLKNIQQTVNINPEANQLSLIQKYDQKINENIAIQQYEQHIRNLQEQLQQQQQLTQMLRLQMVPIVNTTSKILVQPEKQVTMNQIKENLDIFFTSELPKQCDEFINSFKLTFDYSNQQRILDALAEFKLHLQDLFNDARMEKSKYKIEKVILKAQGDIFSVTRNIIDDAQQDKAILLGYVVELMGRYTLQGILLNREVQLMFDHIQEQLSLLQNQLQNNAAYVQQCIQQIQ